MENRYRSHTLCCCYVLIDDDFPTVKADCLLARNIYMVINIHIIMSTSAGHLLRCIGGEPIAVVCRMHNAAPCLLYRYAYQLHPHFLRSMSLCTRKQQPTLACEQGVVLLIMHCTFPCSPWTKPHSPHVPSSGCPHGACSHTTQQEGCVHTSCSYGNKPVY